MSTTRTKPRRRRRKLGHVRVLEIALSECRPSPENDRLYRPVDPTDSDIQALAESIRRHGVKEPLVITEDRWILSGHRRFAAAKLAGLRTVPCRTEPIRRNDDLDRFVQLLREFNRQREKDRAERLREEVLSINPDEAYASLISHRNHVSEVSTEKIAIVGKKRRCKISKGKKPFLDAILRILEERRAYWPLSVRAIHYALLNDPPLKHASKSNSIFTNDRKSYNSADELLTRARLEGIVAMEAISDETRPVTVCNVDQSPTVFIRRELDGFLKGYWRDLMQSQPNHIEIVCEKNTVEGVLKKVAMEYCIPLTSGRGYCSLPPRYQMVQRYRKSGKDKLVILMLSDFDPDGEEIAHSFARSIRDDFGVTQIHPIQVALTANQVARHRLPKIMEAKNTSSNYDKFVEKHGKNVFELEALPPDVLQQALREAVDAVIDIDAFNDELDAEREDAAFLQGVRSQVSDVLSGLDLV